MQHRMVAANCLALAAAVKIEMEYLLVQIKKVTAFMRL
jgi:hypothetical protein